MTLLTLMAALACHHESAQVASGANADTAGAGLDSAAAGDSAAQFTWAFYDWYVRGGARYDSTIMDRAALFDPELLRALNADAEAQAKDSENIVGLDWDPFLDSQDPCTRYYIGRSIRHGDRMLVSISGTCTGKLEVHVVAELARRGPSWVFVNFRHAADTGSLLSDLRRLREARDSERSRD